MTLAEAVDVRLGMNAVGYAVDVSVYACGYVHRSWSDVGCEMCCELRVLKREKCSGMICTGAV